MSAVHLHLLVNHVPILGAFFALPLLVVALWRRAEQAALLGAVLVLVLTGAGAVTASQSGEAGEESVEELPGVTSDRIEVHEERAELATPIAVGNALAALAVLVWTWRRGSTPLVATGGLLVTTAVTAGLLAWTGWAGGQIRHTEIRAEGGLVSSADGR